MNNPDIIVINNEVIARHLETNLEDTPFEHVRTRERWEEVMNQASIIISTTSGDLRDATLLPVACIEEVHDMVRKALKTNTPPRELKPDMLWMPPSIIDCDTEVVVQEIRRQFMHRLKGYIDAVLKPRQTNASRVVPLEKLEKAIRIATDWRAHALKQDWGDSQIAVAPLIDEYLTHHGMKKHLPKPISKD